jgi:cysteine desulfurase
MIKACNSCLYNIPLKVNKYGEINLEYLDDILYRYNAWEPLVCIEAANSEIGTINDVISIANIVHKHNGIIIVDATGYIPTIQVDMQAWKDIDILTFSGHKLNSLKGCGVLYKRKDIELKPLIYGSQEKGLFGGTENVLGIAALGKAVEKFDYSSINTDNRDYVYHKLINEVPECYLVGADLEYRLPHNLYMCFKGIEGESLMILLDEKDIQVSTGSACTSGDLKPSATLTAIGLNEEDIHSCIRMSFSGSETKEQLDYLCEAIKNNVTILRSLKD